ncbi:MAG: ABC transporter substrate-binding protein, partial [Clostridiales bacterium]|nr:ABC transporter substrate-binding protein [Clostridiales bacterium]
MKKNLKRTLSVILSLAMLASLTACGSDSSTSSNTTTSAVSDNGSSDTAAEASSTSGTDTVKVGSLWPLTGGSATIGQQHADGAKAAIKEINENGGIQSMGGAQIELVGADTQSSADQGSIAAERLITEDNVCMIIGAYNSTVCISSSEVAQKYEIPFVSMGGVATDVTERGYDYVFRVNNTATYDVVEMITALDSVLEDLGEDTLTYSLIYENSDWGSDNARIWKEYADERGWTCVLDEPVENGQADMTSQVLKIKSADADVVNVSFYTDDAIVFTNAMYANQVSPRLGVWSVGGGWQDSSFYESVTPEAYMYNFVQEDWDMSGVQNKEWIQEVADMCQEEYGYNMSSFFAQ